MTLRVLVPVTGAFEGRLRVRRSTGELDTEGLDRVLSEPSVRAMSLACQLRAHDATITAVHVDKGAGDEVLREALAHGADQGILIEGAAALASDASTRAATMADIYRQSGPFDAVVGPMHSEFAGFSGALAALAGLLDLPIVHGARDIAPLDGGFRIRYTSIFGDYDLRIPRPCVVGAGDVAPLHATAWDIARAYEAGGVLRVQADQYAAGEPRTRRMRIGAVRHEAHAVEHVDGATLVRRLRSRSLIPEREADDA